MRIDRPVAESRQRLAIVVDGDEESRRVCRTTLADAGFEVITATDAAAALLVARFAPPDVVLLDVDLPSLSSLVLARDIRADARLRDSHIIALTGELAPQGLFQRHATRFDRVLVKPADQQRLLDAVGASLVPA